MQIEPLASNKPGDSTQAPQQQKKPFSRWLPGWLNRDLTLLFGGRGLRSLAQGYLAVIVPLYLAQLGFDAVHLGILFTASAIASAVLASAVGFLSDRFGRKTFLILISLLMAGGGLVFALSGNFLVLVLAGALGTIGRGGGAGSGGAWGPYYPAEQALIAEHADNTYRTTIFGALSFVGVLTGAVGSLLAYLPQFLLGQHLTSSIFTGYHVLFYLTVVLGIVMALITFPIHEFRVTAGEVKEGRKLATQKLAAKTKEKKAQTQTGEGKSKDGKPRGVFSLSATTWQLILRFMITNSTNGLAIGMLGSFLVYWFYKRYGVGAGEIGVLFFIINLAAALPYLLAGWLARRLGAVNTVVITRAVSVVLLAVMALMPTYLLAAVIYLVRMIANTLSNPVRQSYLMGVIPPRERARAAGLSNMPSQITASIGPYIAGYLIQTVSLDLPLELSALFMGINTVLYWAFFRNIHPPEEQQE